MTSPVFVGRAAELASLERAYERVRAGDPAVVLIGAEAGGGKTRLIKEFVRERRSLVGGCVGPDSAGLPYAPFTAMLRELGVDEITALMPGDAARDLARLLPALGEPPPGAESHRVRLFERMLTLLERLGARGPRVLVVEDAHWADQSTRDLIAFLARNLHGVPALLLITHRPHELATVHPLRALFAELVRLDHVTRLDLPPLSRAEVAGQLAGILGGPGEPDRIRRVHERSAGIPLFVEAIADYPGEAVPGSLRDLLMAGFWRLPARTQEVLRTASAGGDPVRHDLLAAVTGLDEDDLTSALRPAVDRNLILTQADGYIFRHALIREAVHEELLPGERPQLHRRYAETIEAAPHLTERPAIALTAHWHAAQDPARAMTAAWRAAVEHRTSAAYPEQLDMLERVLDLWERVPEAGSLIERRRIEVMELAATAASACGAAERGLAMVRAAQAMVDQAQDPAHAASLMVLQAELRGFDSLSAQIEDLLAAERLTSAPTPVRARLLAQLSSRFLIYGDERRSEFFGAQGLALARELGDKATEADLAITVAAAAAQDGEGDLAPLEAVREAVARQQWDDFLHLRVLIHLSHCYEGAGRSEDAARTAAEGLAVAHRSGLTGSQGVVCAINLAESLFSAGHWDQAAEIIERTTERAYEPAPRSQLMIWRAALRGARGEGPVPDEDAMAQPFDAGAPQTMLPLAQASIELRLAEGDRGGAETVSRKALANPGLTWQPRYTWPFLVAAAKVGGPVLAQVRAVAAHLPVRGPVAAAHAATLAATGTADRTAWSAAVTAWEALGRPYPLAQALFQAASAELASGDRRAAAAGLERAATLAARLGAEPLAGQIAEQARSTRGPAERSLVLTPREREVLKHLALGRSNREIAAELSITAKTVSVHVSNIMAKLGVSSRGRAAAAARDQLDEN